MISNYCHPLILYIAGCIPKCNLPTRFKERYCKDEIINHHQKTYFVVQLVQIFLDFDLELSIRSKINETCLGYTGCKCADTDGFSEILSIYSCRSCFQLGPGRVRYSLGEVQAQVICVSLPVSYLLSLSLLVCYLLSLSLLVCYLLSLSLLVCYLLSLVHSQELGLEVTRSRDRHKADSGVKTLQPELQKEKICLGTTEQRGGGLFMSFLGYRCLKHR